MILPAQLERLMGNEHWNFTKGRTGDVREVDRAFMSKVNEMVGIDPGVARELMSQRGREAQEFHGNMQARVDERLTPTAAQQASPLELEFKRMARDIDALHTQVEILSMRLSPVLCDSNEPPRPETIEKSPPASPVCAEVRGHADHVARAALRLSALIQGLTL